MEEGAKKRVVLSLGSESGKFKIDFSRFTMIPWWRDYAMGTNSQSKISMQNSKSCQQITELGYGARKPWRTSEHPIIGSSLRSSNYVVRMKPTRPHSHYRRRDRSQVAVYWLEIQIVQDYFACILRNFADVKVVVVQYNSCFFWLLRVMNQHKLDYDGYWQ